MVSKYVIGVDYGTDSCRAIVVDALTGRRIASAVRHYPRWREGLYCDPSRDMYRQHPLDYIESLEGAVSELVGRVSPEIVSGVCAISFDTTASTPVVIDAEGTPLALLPELADDPDAMFVLWKDHTAIEEAARINTLARSGSVDYTKYVGGSYSAEWVWAKMLHVLGGNPSVRAKAHSWLEHSDWMGALLTGCKDPVKIARSRCTAGHKAMWNAEWGGYPPAEFLSRLDPLLGEMRRRLPDETFTADRPVGSLTAEWAGRLGLPEGITVAAGSVDAHMGAIGAGISPGVLTRIMGTSTCDILVCPHEDIAGRLIRGICGQVDGSVLPGYTGLEAGQSAFGDVYAWFKNLLLWPTKEFGIETGEAEDKIIPRLSELASRIAPGSSPVSALDWFNGRRTPDADLGLKGALGGLTLATTPAMIFRALVEATAFGSRAIVERFLSEGVRISSIAAIGGIAQKSPFVMQTLADVLNMPVKVIDSDQACALGVAMCAATAAGIYGSLPEAQMAMAPPVGREYLPDAATAGIYSELYARYERMGGFFENTETK